jgi:hypothetical protein
MLARLNASGLLFKRELPAGLLTLQGPDWLASLGLSVRLAAVFRAPEHQPAPQGGTNEHNSP